MIQKPRCYWIAYWLLVILTFLMTLMVRVGRDGIELKGVIFGMVLGFVIVGGMKLWTRRTFRLGSWVCLPVMGGIFFLSREPSLLFSLKIVSLIAWIMACYWFYRYLPETWE